MRFAHDMFQSRLHRGRRRVLDISGDGPNNDGALVTGPRRAMVEDGITINGLPIINGRPSRYGTPPLDRINWYYENYVIGGRVPSSSSPTLIGTSATPSTAS